MDCLRRECDDLRRELAQQQAEVRPATLLSFDSAFLDPCTVSLRCSMLSM